MVVVALGGSSATAARSLAREIYADPALRAPIDEATAQVLCGAAPAPDDARGRELAELRAGLDPDPGSPTTRRVLESLAAELGASAVVAVASSDSAGPRGRIIRVGAAADAGIELAGGGSAAAPSWPGSAGVLRSLLGVTPVAATAPPPPTPPTKASKPAATAPGTIASPADAATAAEDAFYERPWFWVALGAFAVAGVTALVVSQTSADEPVDAVHFRATIPQVTFSLP